MRDRPIIPVILCGGYGTRLWPISKETKPKQFLKLFDGKCLYQLALERAMKCAGVLPDHIITVTLKDFEDQVNSILAPLGPNAQNNLLYEPSSKNTAAAICYAALYAEIHYGPRSILWVMPSDHLIEDLEALEIALGSAYRAAKDGYIATFGIDATVPDTSFGYIKPGRPLMRGRHARKVREFVEKPDSKTAEGYVDYGYLWNSGMFVLRTKKVLDEYQRLMPDMFDTLRSVMTHKHDFQNPPEDVYDALPKISFDEAIMERTQKAAVISCDLGWTDIGTWERLEKVVDFADNDNPDIDLIHRRV